MKAGLVLAALALTLSAAQVSATEEDDEMFQSGRPAPTLKSKTRSYPGARDEQRLEVQVSLPQPTRNPDGTMTPHDDGDEPVTAPASD